MQKIDVAVKANFITVEGAVAEHRYKVYQIVTGTIDETTDEDRNIKVTIGNAKLSKMGLYDETTNR